MSINKKQISKKNFEMELFKKHKSKLSKIVYREKNAKDKVCVITCYYVNNEHIGSWCEGKGWILK